MASNPEKEPSFEQLSDSAQPSLLAEFFDFLKHNKKWWLLPILLMIGVFGLLIALASTGVAPFIYTLF
jgi:membrane-bound ClpP family serine protease